jgi:L-cysteine S-thiosulfotransferase
MHARIGHMILSVLIAAAGCADKTDLPRQLAGADPERGRRTVERVGCAACHRIPGVAWPRGRVGGSLDGFARRPLIAGRLPNQPQILVQWLQDAPSLSPGTGMPPVALSTSQARDVAAYLYTLQ